ncbi:hypothetical protein RJT34_10458 [Clitoria ternatea]|uniref:Uncharacterized protein n=1 Tax=Clitoria ternatea TaxID=43366 RepID=A0AAN9PW10_CLITE
MLSYVFIHNEWEWLDHWVIAKHGWIQSHLKAQKQLLWVCLCKDTDVMVWGVGMVVKFTQWTYMLTVRCRESNLHSLAIKLVPS